MTETTKLFIFIYTHIFCNIVYAMLIVKAPYCGLWVSDFRPSEAKIRDAYHNHANVFSTNIKDGIHAPQSCDLVVWIIYIEMSAKYLPKNNPTVSFWLNHDDPFLKHRSGPQIPDEVDVVIIGSGYSGTSTAYHLQEQNGQLKIAMFEARDICSGATGRNGGHIKPYGHRMYEYYAQAVGEEQAAEIVNSEFEHLWTLKKIIEDNSIDCDFFLTRACDVYPNSEDPRVKKDLAGFYAMLRNPMVKDEFKREIQLLTGDAAKRASKNERTEMAFTYPAASCWPWKLMTGILKKCVDRGLSLHANTPVVSVQQYQGKRWIVKTTRGSTICSKVVYCTNGYTKALLKEFSDTILPVRGVVSSLTPSTGQVVPHLTNTYGFMTDKPQNYYLINRLDGTVIVGGHGESLFTETSDPFEQVLDCVDDSFVNAKSFSVFNKNFMKDKFVTWKNTQIGDVKLWTGIMGFTNDYLPYVGGLECLGYTNAYIVAGFHGHGMPRVWLSGKAIASCIVQDKPIEEIEYTCPRAFFLTHQRVQHENLYRQHLYAKYNFKPKL